MEDTDLSWRTSSYSSNGGGECVEVGQGDHVIVRDSKNPAGPVLRVAPENWVRFTRRVGAA